MHPVQAGQFRKRSLAASTFHTQTQAFNHVFVVKHRNQSGHLPSATRSQILNAGLSVLVRAKGYAEVRKETPIQGPLLSHQLKLNR